MTPKQAIFYGEYIKDTNATRAAIVAGCPESSAHVAGARLLRNVKVAAAIEKWRQRKTQQLEITAERVLQELMCLATFDAGRLYRADGSRIPVHLLDDHTRAAVASVEDETQESLGDADGEGVKPLLVTRKQRIKMAEKGANLERLAKHLGLFAEGAFSATVTPGPGGLPPDSTIKIVLVRPA